MRLLIITSILIGVVDYVGLQLLPITLNDSIGLAWMFTALILWVAVFGFGLYRWGVRSLWSLLGLPLVLFPFALIVIGAGMI